MPDLVQVLQKDERPVLRGTAAWAIGKIGTDGAENILLAARKTEQDEEVFGRD